MDHRRIILGCRACGVRRACPGAHSGGPQVLPQCADCVLARARAHEPLKDNAGMAGWVFALLCRCNGEQTWCVVDRSSCAANACAAIHESTRLAPQATHTSKATGASKRAQPTPTDTTPAQALRLPLAVALGIIQAVSDLWRALNLEPDPAVLQPHPGYGSAYAARMYAAWPAAAPLWE